MLYGVAESIDIGLSADWGDDSSAEGISGRFCFGGQAKVDGYEKVPQSGFFCVIFCWLQADAFGVGIGNADFLQQ